MRRLLNRARRIELEAASKGKERPILTCGWDLDPFGKPVEKYWILEAAELNEHTDTISLYTLEEPLNTLKNWNTRTPNYLLEIEKQEWR